MIRALCLAQLAAASVAVKRAWKVAMGGCACDEPSVPQALLINDVRMGTGSYPEVGYSGHRSRAIETELARANAMGTVPQTYARACGHSLALVRAH